MTVYGRLLGSLASTRVEGDWEEASNSCGKSSGRSFKKAKSQQTSDTIPPSSELDSPSLYLNTEDWASIERKLLFLLPQRHAIHHNIFFLRTCDYKESVLGHAL